MHVVAQSYIRGWGDKINYAETPKVLRLHEGFGRICPYGVRGKAPV